MGSLGSHLICELGAGAGAGLAQQVLDVLFHRPQRQVQPGGDLLVCAQDAYDTVVYDSLSAQGDPDRLSSVALARCKHRMYGVNT
jgi:hypothetical protein